MVSKVLCENFIWNDMSAAIIHTTQFPAHWKSSDCCVCLKYMEVNGKSWSMREAQLSGIRK